MKKSAFLVIAIAVAAIMLSGIMMNSSPVGEVYAESTTMCDGNCPDCPSPCPSKNPSCGGNCPDCPSPCPSKNPSCGGNCPDCPTPCPSK